MKEKNEVVSGEPPRGMLANWGLPAGPILALIIWALLGFTELEREPRCMAGVIILMAVWWMTEAIPLAATALLPLVLFPVLPIFPDSVRVGADVFVEVSDDQTDELREVLASVASIRGDEATVQIGMPDGSVTVQAMPLSELAPVDDRSAFERAATPFANRFIFLFLGGFLIALSIERWNLHRRIALLTLNVFGTAPKMIIAGFMVATATLSMWISNTATTVMMLPIAMSVAGTLLDVGRDQNKPTSEPAGSKNKDRDRERFATCLMLGIAYAASIGGIATLVGTPPNALLASFLADNDRPVSFVGWMIFAFPISVVFLALTWLVLTHVAFRFRLSPIEGGREVIHSELHALGRLNAGEKVTIAVFAMTAGMWLFRKPLVSWDLVSDALPFLTKIDDSIIAMMGGLALFLIPVSLRPIRMTMNWEYANRLPWGILLLFGGGLSLAQGVQASGLGSAIGTWIGSLPEISLLAVMFLVALIVVFLTEFTSNMATTSLFLPVLLQVSLGMTGVGGDVLAPEFLLIPATLAASMAFMLPVATPPNAIVFASQRVTIPQMVRAGLILNVLAAILIPLLVYFLASSLLGFS